MIDKLDKSQSHYLTKVMRLKKNNTFSLFNKTGEWEAKILNITKDFVEFKSTKQLRQKEITTYRKMLRMKWNLNKQKKELQEAKRLEKKRDAGARFLQTQMVMDPYVLENFCKDIAETLGLPVLAGVFLLKSAKNRTFLKITFYLMNRN